MEKNIQKSQNLKKSKKCENFLKILKKIRKKGVLTPLPAFLDFLVKIHKKSSKRLVWGKMSKNLLFSTPDVKFSKLTKNFKKND